MTRAEILCKIISVGMIPPPTKGAAVMLATLIPNIVSPAAVREDVAIHYRVGGTARFAWREVPCDSLSHADKLAADLARMGYANEIVPACTPLPTTFDHPEARQ